MEMKSRFRDGISRFGFDGYICDKSLFKPLSDNEILHGKKNSAPGPLDFMKAFSERNLYNDIAQRLGGRCDGYLSAISKAAETYFGDHRGRLARNFVRRRLTPFLNVGDAPRAQSMLLKTVFAIGRDFDQPAFADRLSVPIEIADGQTVYIGLFTQRRLGARDVLAAINLTYFYHELCQSRLNSAEFNSASAEAIILGSTQLECIKWAVAGKTVEDISVLTGLHNRTVRYHMEQARKRYGYATMRQTLARAACDYHLDPMG